MQAAPGAPILLWFRRDLRLTDHPALAAAIATGRPVIPVFILGPEVADLGAAPKWRLGKGLEVFARSLPSLGSRLILRRGDPADVFTSLIAETGAVAVHWMRSYDPAQAARDEGLAEYLSSQGIAARSFKGALLAEPQQVATKTGGFYRVFTPFWRTLSQIGKGETLPKPTRIAAPKTWPASDHLGDWRLGREMNRCASVVEQFCTAGEDAAWDQLDQFLKSGLPQYAIGRDLPHAAFTSALSENLALGEISARAVWNHVSTYAAIHGLDPTAYLRQLAWRDFAWHLFWHTPHIAVDNWAPRWQAFPWRADNEYATAWKRGITGEPLVDAGIRQLHITGRMHNRVRMIAASYLTKHLLTHWSVGQKFFADHLTDWDPASNALGWQWVAGSGPDSAPYFRVFNPALQAQKFDPKGSYRNRYLGNGKTAQLFYDAIPRHWQMQASDAAPKPIIDLAAGRARALAAYTGFAKSG
jgi:deoxyribodipyrimidine photo-lyase